MVERAIAVGLDALVLTEHNIVWPQDELAPLQDRYPEIKLLRGIEVTSAEGDDFLVYGVTESGVFSGGMPAHDVARVTHDRGGAIVLAHPYRYRPTVPEMGGHRVDGVEIMSIHVLNYAYIQAKALCEEWEAFGLATTDAHHVDALGLYAVRFDEPVEDERDLALKLLARQFTTYADRQRLRAANDDLATRLEQAHALLRRGWSDELVRDAVPGVSLTMVQGLRRGDNVLYPTG